MPSFKLIGPSAAARSPAARAPDPAVAARSPAARAPDPAAAELERAKAAFRRRETTVHQLVGAWYKCPPAARKRYPTISEFLREALDGVADPRR